MNLDSEIHRLWDSLTTATRKQYNVSELSLQVQILAERVEIGDFEFEQPMSDELKALIQRAKHLAEEFTAHEQEIENGYQDAAWAFAAAAFDIKKGDYIQHTNWKGEPQSLSADDLHLSCSVFGERISSCEVGDLYVNGRIVKKDGTPGKKTDGIHLRKETWTKKPLIDPEKTPV